VIVETYPAECYGWFFQGGVKGKGDAEIRKKAGGALFKWAEKCKVALGVAIRKPFFFGVSRLIKLYVDHYNTIRLHSAIGYVTPQDRLAGRQAEPRILCAARCESTV